MSETRTRKSIYNFFTAIGVQLLTIIMSFVSRTVFISVLGKTYLGLNGLFTNILTMLSLTEMGVGTAITFYMYEPLARNDQKRILVLLNFYKKLYRIIAVVITVVGLCLIPFLPYLVKGYEKLEAVGLNAIFIYLLYLSKSVFTYLFFAYRTILIKADQKEYILNIKKYIIILVMNAVQIATLLLLQNFTVYVIVMISFTIIENIEYAVIVSKRYPYISNKPEGKLEKKEIKLFFKDTGAVFLYKLNRVILKSTDNIVLSAFLGLGAVALFSNYYVFYMTINDVYYRINDALIHSIGNLHTTHNAGHEYQIFKTMIMIMTIIGGTVAVGIAVTADELITLWIGKEWVINQPFSILMGIELLVLCIQYFMSKYRNALGLFQQLKTLPLLGSIINIISSIILVHVMGISGVVLGTIIAEFMVFMIVDPYVIYKYGFKNQYSIGSFYLQLGKQLCIIAISFFISRKFCSIAVPNTSWFSLLIHVAICGIITPVLLVLINIHTDEIKLLLSFVKKRFKKVNCKT